MTYEERLDRITTLKRQRDAIDVELHELLGISMLDADEAPARSAKPANGRKGSKIAKGGGITSPKACCGSRGFRHKKDCQAKRDSDHDKEAGNEEND